MSITEVSITDARANLADLVNRVTYGGERIALVKHGKVTAVLVSPAAAAALHELEAREDAAAARIAERKGETVSLEAFKAELEAADKAAGWESEDEPVGK